MVENYQLLKKSSYYSQIIGIFNHQILTIKYYELIYIFYDGYKFHQFSSKI